MNASGAQFSLSSPRNWEKKNSITEIKGPSLLILYFVQTTWWKFPSEFYTWPSMSMNLTLHSTICLSITLNGSCAGSGPEVFMVWYWFVVGRMYFRVLAPYPSPKFINDKDVFALFLSLAILEELQQNFPAGSPWSFSGMFQIRCRHILLLNANTDKVVIREALFFSHWSQL